MSVLGNWKTVNSANWKLNAELISSMYLLVVVKVESGIDIMEDNFLFGVQVRYPKGFIPWKSISISFILSWTPWLNGIWTRLFNYRDTIFRTIIAIANITCFQRKPWKSHLGQKAIHIMVLYFTPKIAQ